MARVPFRFEFDKLILATGTSPMMPPVPGIELQGVTTLHSLHDADFLRAVREEGRMRFVYNR